MQLYLSKLVIVLDGERGNWRNDTTIMLDGAKYHTCEATRKHLALLGIPVIFTAPYSYDGSPIELFFAYFKSTQINPLLLPTGKK